MQTRKGSAAEAITNILVGYTINFLANLFILPLLGYDLTVKHNLIIGLFFTVVSVVRSYSLRRLYNRFNFFN